MSPRWRPPCLVEHAMYCDWHTHRKKYCRPVGGWNCVHLQSRRKRSTRRKHITVVDKLFYTLIPQVSLVQIYHHYITQLCSHITGRCSTLSCTLVSIWSFICFFLNFSAYDINGKVSQGVLPKQTSNWGLWLQIHYKDQTIEHSICRHRRFDGLRFKDFFILLTVILISFEPVFLWTWIIPSVSILKYRTINSDRTALWGIS